MTTKQVALSLDCVDPSDDPDVTHMEVEAILVKALGPEVDAAYERLLKRCHLAGQ